jgi:CTP-dependent riboflavin kinase
MDCWMSKLIIVDHYVDCHSYRTNLPSQMTFNPYHRGHLNAQIRVEQEHILGNDSMSGKSTGHV